MVDAITTAASPVSKFRSPATVAVDNLLRKTLRVSDPRDPDQIANALLNFYPEEADRDRRERAGLPYSSAPDYVPPTKNTGPSSVELAQAQDDLERDLQTLSTSSPLKDIRIELIGWGRSIRQLANDGLAAARLALDSVNHDRAMAARRQLGEYSRLARYIGTLTDGSAILFRRFAQSCDVLAALILVAIGEGLASSGITRSTSLVRSAAGELQARRNAVIMALRSLTGSVESSLSQEDWPRGIEAYRNLVQQLEAGGQADLRALLEEGALAQAMDDLVDLSTGASVEGLRELSTASSLLVHRFQRLIQFGQSMQVPFDKSITEGSAESPPLVAFVSSLQLFVDAFVSKGSSRLLYVARPPIVVYGLYGAGGPDKGARRLMKLADAHGLLLEQADCFAGCGCDDDDNKCQILVDYMLFLSDRAIDLYAVGTHPSARGEQEKRATAIGLFIDAAVALTDPKAKSPLSCEFSDDLKKALRETADLLLKEFGGDLIPPPGKQDMQALMVRELRIAYQAEDQTERLVRSLTPQCGFDVFNFDNSKHSLIRWMIRGILKTALKEPNPNLPKPVQIPSPLASSLASIAQNRPDFWSAG